jgi:hypothetical protein
MAVTSRFIAALTEAAVPLDELGLEASQRDAVLAEAAGFVEGQVAALPRRLGLMFALGTSVFRFYVRLTRMRSFCALPAAQRRVIFEQWAYGRVGLFRALFKLPRSTALLVFFEHAAVREALDRAGSSAAGRGAAR